MADSGTIAKRRCYLCGSTDDLTRDHIPPKCFFPEPRPVNLITVSCCRTCNQSYSEDDEANRLWLCASHGASKAGEWILTNKAVRSKPELIGAMLDSIERTKLLTVEEGEIELDRYEVPWDRIERFQLRMAKGLLTHYYPSYDYSSAIF